MLASDSYIMVGELNSDGVYNYIPSRDDIYLISDYKPSDHPTKYSFKSLSFC